MTRTVLILADCLDNGGLERQMALLATSLPAAWRRHVWTMGGGPFEAHLRERGVNVTVHERRARFDPLPAVALWRDLRAWRPDVVHSWSWMSALAAGPACRALGIPFIDGMIQTGSLEPDFTRLKRLGMATATLVVANTQAGLDAWGVGPAKGRVVYNGFDASRLPASGGAGDAPAPSRGPAAEGDGAAARFTVIMTGRMVPVKHYDIVIAAARELSGKEPGWRFVLVGQGSDRARLQREAADLAARDVVVFPEPGMEVLDLVRRADVGVLMTNPELGAEGLSNSIMEYMALGLPVVCGAGGGNAEIVLDGVTGLVVPPADPVALADHLAYLRAHDEERRAMGVAGRSRILTEFSVEAMVARMIAVYEEALSPGARV
jgi:glycosyltransferase involved in cell wall biosynthesis